MYIKSDNFFKVWTYVTNGFNEKDKKEIVLSLKCSETDLKEGEKVNYKNFPEEPLHLFANIYDECVGDTIIDECEWRSWNDEDGFLSKNFKGIAFGPLDYKFLKSNGIHLSDSVSYILAHPLYQKELEICKKCGVARILSLLGEQARQFPTPTYVSRDRDCVIEIEIENLKISKVHEKAEQILISELSAVLNPQSKKITLTVDPILKPLFNKVITSFSEETPITFNLTFSKQSEHHIIWHPDHNNQLDNYKYISRSSIPIKKPNELVGGSFLSFFPCQSSKDLVTIHEDGFIAMLSTHNWSTIRQCLSLGLTFIVKSDSENGLELEVIFIEEP